MKSKVTMQSRLFLLTILLLAPGQALPQESGKAAKPLAALHWIDAKTPSGLQDLFQRTAEPLPFVSAGGSSLLINLVGMGILLNVSQHVTSPEA
jgi:hypothetical protein